MNPRSASATIAARLLVAIISTVLSISGAHAAARDAAGNPVYAAATGSVSRGVRTLAAGQGSITGHVVDANGQAIGGLIVFAYDGKEYYYATGYRTDSNGNYTIPNLVDGNYFVNACDCSDFNRYVDTWYPNVWDTEFWRNLVPATALVVKSGSSARGDFRIDFGGVILLTLKDAQGNPIDAKSVRTNLHGCYGSMDVDFHGARYDVNGSCIGGRDFNDGRYEPYVVPRGRTYYLKAWPSGYDFTPLWYEHSATREGATPIHLTSTEPLPITMVLSETGHSISGRMSFSQASQVTSPTVTVWSPQGDAVASVTPAADGTFTVTGLRDGEYNVQFRATALVGTVQKSLMKYYRNAPSFAYADRVVVHGADVTGIDVVLDTPADAAPLRANTTLVSLIAPAGGKSDATPVAIWTDSGSIDWTATAASDWLRFSPSSGRVTGGGGAKTISISADASNLQPGTYTDTLTIAGTSGPALLIAVTLTVTPPPAQQQPPVETSAQSLSFSGELSQFPPQTITLTNRGTSPLTWNLRSTIASAYPPSGTLAAGESADVSIAANVTSLEFGSVNGLVEVLTNGRITGTIRVNVSVAPAPVPVDRFGGSFLHVGTNATPVPPSLATVVPAVASNLRGQGGSNWTSDVYLSNLPSSLRSNLSNFIFTPFGSSNAAGSMLVRGTVKLPATMLASPVANMFRSSGMGALDVRPEATGLASWSRIWTLAKSGRGTYGQEIPAFDTSTALKAGESGIVPVVLGGGAYRTNVLFSEIAGSSATARLEVIDSSGATISSQDVALDAFQQKSAGNIVPSSVPVAYARITVSGAGTVGAVTTLVDNVTNDPTTVMVMKGAPLTSTGRLIVPGIGRTGGANNTTWRSDVWLVNAGTAPLRFRAMLYPGGGVPPLTGREYTVAAGAQVTLSDSVLSDFNLTTGRGALLLDVTSGDSHGVRMISRTFNLGENGTLGNGVRAVEADEEAANGEAGLVLFGMQRNRDFRTNLQIQETTGNAVTVEISATATRTDSPGVSLSTATTRVDLPGYDFYQLGDVLGLLGLPLEAANARIVLKVVGGSGRIVAYGSMVDNVTGDPTTVPAFRLAE